MCGTYIYHCAVHIVTTVRYTYWPLCGTYSDHCAVHIVTTGAYIHIFSSVLREFLHVVIIDFAYLVQFKSLERGSRIKQNWTNEYTRFLQQTNTHGPCNKAIHMVPATKSSGYDTRHIIFHCNISRNYPQYSVNRMQEIAETKNLLWSEGHTW